MKHQNVCCSSAETAPTQTIVFTAQDAPLSPQSSPGPKQSRCLCTAASVLNYTHSCCFSLHSSCRFGGCFCGKSLESRAGRAVARLRGIQKHSVKCWVRSNGEDIWVVYNHDKGLCNLYQVYCAPLLFLDDTLMLYRVIEALQQIIWRYSLRVPK